MFRQLSAAAVACLFSGAAAPAAASTVLELLWPVACQNGVDCVIQQYVDMDPGPGVRDAACGARAYDGHSGVDIRLASFADLANDVPVLAAADGVVSRLRDNAPDRAWDGAELSHWSPDGRDCGNGLVIDHGEGWETQYCHLQRGSLQVSAGERVAAGTALGTIGMSGRTEFPHLHFTVRRRGKVVSPFMGTEMGEPCGQERSLWADADLAYEPVTLLDAGFADRAPDYAEARSGTLAVAAPRGGKAPAVVFWARLLGLAAGDVATVALIGPDGDIISSNQKVFPRDRAVQFLFSGRKRRGETWPPGEYQGRVTLRRGGETLIDRRFELQL